MLVSGGVGAKLEASFDAGTLLELASKIGGNVKRATDAFGNPLQANIPEKLSVEQPFCLKDLHFANVAGASVGVDAGVVGTGVSGLNVRSRSMSSLFYLSGAQLQAILGAGINMGAIQGGRLIDLYPTELCAADQADIQAIKRDTPYQYRASTGPAGGW